MAVKLSEEALKELEFQRLQRIGHEEAKASLEGRSKPKKEEELPEGLESFMDPTTPLTVGKVTYDLSPMVMRQVIDFTQVAEPFMPLLVEGLKKQDVPLGLIFQTHGQEFLQSIAIALVEPTRGGTKAGLEAARRDKLADLEVLSPSDFLLLAGKVVLVNVDFFHQRLQQAALLARKAIEPLKAG